MGRRDDGSEFGFLNAPFEADGWLTALAALARETGSARAQLVAFGGPHDIPFNRVSDEPEGWLEGWIAMGGGDPTLNWRVACADAPLRIVGEEAYDLARPRMRSQDYTDFAETYDMPLGCQTVLSQAPDHFFGLALLRSRADGRTGERERDVFARAAREALAGVRLQKALDHQGVELLTLGLEATRAAAVICDVAGRVVGLTPAAEAALRERSGLRISGGDLFARLPDDTARLHAALREVHDQPGHSVRLWVSEPPDPRDGCVCEVHALPRREWSFAHGRLMVVTLRRPMDRRAQDEDILRRRLRLTAAEAAVARMVADGLSREEIALRRGASTGTVNAQVHSIFRKSDVNREAELAALIHRILG